MIRFLTYLSLGTLLLTVVVVPVIVARMREDYWVREMAPEEFRHPVLRIAALVAKNLLGAVLVIAGAVMVILPGPGILTLLVGLSLLNFRGKREIELRIVRLKPVRTAVQWLRKRAGQPPLQIP